MIKGPPHWIQLFPDDPMPAQAFGEVAFTSFTLRHGLFPNWQLNIERLYRSIQILNAGELPFSIKDFEEGTANFLNSNVKWPEFSLPHYCRLTLIPQTISPTIGAPIEGWKAYLQMRNLNHSKQGISVAVVKRQRNSMDPFCKISQYANESIDRRRLGKLVQDVIYCNQTNELFEATTSNILINHNDVFYFVPNQSLVIHGITQRILEEQLPILGMRVQHTPKTLSTIKSHGHEYRVWLLNQVSGATSVATLDDIKLDVDEVKTSWLNSILENYGKKNGRIFCEKKP